MVGHHVGEERILTEVQFQEIVARLEGSARAEGRVGITVVSFWSNELRWARNRTSLVSDRRALQVNLTREIRGGRGSVVTNQRDEVSLTSAMAAVEHMAIERANNKAPDASMELLTQELPQTLTWSDATFNRSAEESAAIVRRMTAQAEQAGFLSAGYLEVQGATVGRYDRDEIARTQSWYGRQTQGQCSTTVRHPQGIGSGWAGQSGYDITTFDAVSLATRAFEKCRSGLNPVRIEPGRYTVVLEPQAVADLVRLLVSTTGLSRLRAEDGKGPFVVGVDPALKRYRSKLGLKVVDERITISHDPTDPELGVLPIPGIKPVTWIRNGVLTSLSYDNGYALPALSTNELEIFRSAFRMSGGNTTLEEMIASTERGLLVTRFSDSVVIDDKSLLATGLTRDGLWLIEKGRISKAVRNFRFAESPLFVLNNIEQMGIPVKVFERGNVPMVWGRDVQLGLGTPIVPALKVQDFSFISTVDAL